MVSPNRPATLNRTLLVLFGLLLLGAGAFVLAIALGVLPLLRRDAPVIPTDVVMLGWAPWAGRTGPAATRAASSRGSVTGTWRT